MTKPLIFCRWFGMGCIAGAALSAHHVYHLAAANSAELVDRLRQLHDYELAQKAELDARVAAIEATLVQRKH